MVCMAIYQFIYWEIITVYLNVMFKFNYYLSFSRYFIMASNPRNKYLIGFKFNLYNIGFSCFLIKIQPLNMIKAYEISK